MQGVLYATGHLVPIYAECIDQWSSGYNNVFLTVVEMNELT